MSDTPNAAPTTPVSPNVTAINCQFPRLAKVVNFMSSLFTKRNALIAVLAAALLSYASYVGYSVLTKTPVIPNAPVLALDKASFDIGELITVSVKHNMMAAKTSVSWKVYDGFTEKTDWKSCNADSIFFGSGAVPKNLMVVCAVSYVVDGEIQSFVLQTQVKIGNGPLPPPVPVPPSPNPAPTFPSEKYGLSTAVYKSFNANIKDAKRVELAHAYANNFASILSAINAGGYNSKKVENALADLTANNVKTTMSLGLNTTVTDPFWTDLQSRLVTLQQQTPLTWPVIVQAFTEIKDGLNAIQ